MSPSPTIREARSAADFAAFANLCRAYVGWCRERYRALPWFVEEVFGHQSIDVELGELAGKYGPPQGRTMIAEIDGAIVGAAAYRRLGDGVSELKRLYVTDAGRGLGLGRKLSEAVMAAAKADGHAVIRLDTARLLTEALAMYDAMGFVRIAPYHEYPARLLPELVFMERRL